MEDILIQKLYEIKKYPGMYIGQKSLRNLFFFMLGYHMRQCELQNKIQPPWRGFQEFVQKRYGIKSSHSWEKIIIFFENNDEAAFDKFYELFEEFLKDRPENLK